MLPLKQTAKTIFPCWRIIRRVVTFLLATVGVALGGFGAWYVWFTHRSQPAPEQRQLFEGVSYTRDVRIFPRPIIVHVVSIDLRCRGISFLVTSGNPGQKLPLHGQTTAEFLSNNALQVAVNGDYFYPFHSDSIFSYYPHSGDPVTVEGIAASDGTIYSNQPFKSKFPTLYISKNNSATFNGTNYPIYNAISGLCMLVKDGENLYSKGGGTNKPEPNTAVALDRKGSKLMIFVVDGRQPNFSSGVTFKEFADIIRSYGGWSAMDLDGGGSETLVAQGAGGNPVTLNNPIDCRIPGRERVVANHLGVRALRLPRT